MTKNNIEDLQAGEAFRQTMISRVDGKDVGGFPWWHGWVIMDAFLAGLKHARDKELAMAVRLLIASRGFDNQTVREAREVAAHRRELDAFLAGRPGDDPADRYDSPDRVEHRKFVDRWGGKKRGKRPKNRQDLPG